jgi:Flp pilus assembly protein TadD
LYARYDGRVSSPTPHRPAPPRPRRLTPGLRAQPLAALLLATALLAVGSPACRRAQPSGAEPFGQGQAAVTRGDFSEATVHYRNALAIEPRNGEYMLALAEAYARAGEADRAGNAFELAAELLLERTDVQLKVARLLLLDGKFDAAKLRIDEVLKRDARNVEALTLKGSALVGLRDVDAAIADTESALRWLPDESALLASLGSLRLLKGDSAEGEAALRKAIEIDPKSFNAIVALARYTSSTDRMDEAETLYRRALELRPGSAEINRAIAGLYIAEGRNADAEQWLRRWAETSTDVTAKLTLGDYYATTSRGEQARAVYESIADPGRGVALARLAALEAQAGRAGEALRQLDAALVKYPRDGALLQTSARLLLAAGRADAALARARQAVESEPRSASAHALLGAASMATGDLDAAATSLQRALQLNPAMLEGHMRLAELSLRRGDAARGLQFAQEAASIAPASPAARLLLARAFRQAGNLGAARQELAAVKPPSPAWPPLVLERAALELASGHAEEAHRLYAGALASQPDSIDALAGLVQCDLVLRRPAWARAELDARLARRPDDRAVLMLSARVAAAQGDAARTEQMLKRVIEVAPDTLDAYGMLGQLYAQRGRLPEARREFQALAARQTKPVGPVTMVGMTFLIEGNATEARKEFERALTIDDRAPIPANNLAWLLAQDDDTLGRALELAAMARREMPDQPQVAHTLGWIYYRQGAYQLAARHIGDAAQRDTANPLYAYHLGLALAKSGDIAGARASIRRALDLGRPFEGESDARKTLAEIERTRPGR